MKAVFSKYHTDNIKQIQTLQTDVRPLFYEFIRRLGIAGIQVRITSAKRTPAEQNAEYAKGRTIPGPIVTYVKGDESYHTWGLAIDVAPLKYFGLMLDYSAPTYDKLAAIAKEIGLEWGYKMWGFDKPHFQCSQGISIADLRKGAKLAPVHVNVLANDDTALVRLEERLKTAGFDFIPSHS